MTNKQSAKALRDLVRMAGKVEKVMTAQQEAQKAVAERCDHRVVVELGSVGYDDGYSYSHAPRRACLVCWANEDGWGCGYEIMPMYDRGDVKKVVPAISLPILASYDDGAEFHRLRGSALRLKLFLLVTEGVTKGVPPYWVEHWAKTTKANKEAATKRKKKEAAA